MRKKLGALVALSLIGVTAAYAAGMFPGLPVVGGSAYDTGSGVMAPAGPSVVTGNERVPADTQLSQGRSPQTVLLPMAAIHALPLDFQMLAGGAATYSFTADNTDGGVVFITPGGTISPTTVNFPSSPIDQQRFKITSNATITSLTLAAGAGKHISLTPTTLSALSNALHGYEFVYRSASATWFRLQ